MANFNTGFIHFKAETPAESQINISLSLCTRDKHNNTETNKVKVKTIGKNCKVAKHNKTITASGEIFPLTASFKNRISCVESKIAIKATAIPDAERVNSLRIEVSKIIL